MFKIELYDGNNNLLKTKSDERRAYLGYEGELPEGSYLRVAAPADSYAWVKVDKCIEKSLVYLPDGSLTYRFPFKREAKEALPMEAFSGDRFYFSVEAPDETDLTRRRNVALNPIDQKDCNGSFPHASANVETRNESVFFACNAIDGILSSDGHGRFPYASWGINRQENAAIRIEFGRRVRIDGLGLFLRADYPHDSFWTQVKVSFSDGSEETLQTTDREGVQEFSLKARDVEWAELSDLKKHGDESPFPALTQIEVYGVLSK